MAQDIFIPCEVTACCLKGYVALTAALFAIISELGSVGLASRKPSTTPLSSSAVAQSQGLGASFITNVGACLDKDGDGYGVGPACLGPDADDNDSTVHSANDVVAKYGSINAFLTHLGYQGRFFSANGSGVFPRRGIMLPALRA